MVKYYFFVVCGICFFINDTYSQNQKIVDSLNAVLVDKMGGERYFPLYNLAFEYIDVDNAKALEIIHQAEQAALLAGDSLWIVKSKRVKGQVLYKLEKVGEAILIFRSALSIAQRHKFESECIMISNTFGSIYLFQSSYDQALNYYFKTFELANQLKDTSYIVMSLNNIGITYYQLRDYKKSLQFLTRSLKAGNTSKINGYNTLLNMSLCHSQLKNFPMAEIYVQKSLKICGSNCSNNVMMHIRFARGFILLGTNQYNKAEIEFIKSYAYAKEINDSRIQLDNIIGLTEIYIKQHRFKLAAYYLGEAEKLIMDGSSFNMELIKIYNQLYEMHSLLGNIKKVAYYQGKYIQLRDSIYNEALTTNLMKIESDYQERENNAKIVAQSEIILLKEEIIERQRILNLIVGFLIFISIVFLIFVFRNLQLKKNLNRILDKKIEERTRELVLSRDELLKTLQERDHRIHRASEDITETINTIKGLCLNGMKEFSDPSLHVYMDKIGKTSHHLASNLKFHFQKTTVSSAI